jgi:repressor LexA
MSELHKLSSKQQEILEVIRKSIMRDGQSPTVREIGKVTGLRSSCSVQKHLNRLAEWGYIRRDAYKYRSIELLQEGAPVPRRRTVTIPLVGQVAAGTPIDAIANIEEHYPLPDSLVPRDVDLFMLRVHGDSMINAGIFDNDLVVVKKQETAQDRDIVVARIGEEATVKTFFKMPDNRIRLQPENPHMKAIITTDVKIEGKVILCLRQYA